MLTPVDLAEAFRASSETSSLDDLGAQEATTDSDPALLPRGWWKVDAARTKTIGLEDSILLLRDVLLKDHYDGIFGFRYAMAVTEMDPVVDLIDLFLRQSRCSNGRTHERISKPYQ